MNFTLPPEIETYRARYKAFVAEHILPLERDPTSFDDHENIRLDLLRLQMGSTGIESVTASLASVISP